VLSSGGTRIVMASPYVRAVFSCITLTFLEEQESKAWKQEVLKCWTCISVSLRYHFRSSSETKRNWHVRSRTPFGSPSNFSVYMLCFSLRCEQLTGTSRALQLLEILSLKIFFF